MSAYQPNLDHDVQIPLIDDSDEEEPLRISEDAPLRSEGTSKYYNPYNPYVNVPAQPGYPPNQGYGGPYGPPQGGGYPPPGGGYHPPPGGGYYPPPGGGHYPPPGGGQYPPPGGQYPPPGGGGYYPPPGGGHYPPPGGGGYYPPPPPPPQEGGGGEEPAPPPEDFGPPPDQPYGDFSSEEDIGPPPDLAPEMQPDQPPDYPPDSYPEDIPMENVDEPVSVKLMEPTEVPDMILAHHMPQEISQLQPGIDEGYCGDCGGCKGIICALFSALCHIGVIACALLLVFQMGSRDSGPPRLGSPGIGDPTESPDFAIDNNPNDYNEDYGDSRSPRHTSMNDKSRYISHNYHHKETIPKYDHRDTILRKETVSKHHRQDSVLRHSIKIHRKRHRERVGPWHHHSTGKKDHMHLKHNSHEDRHPSNQNWHSKRIKRNPQGPPDPNGGPTLDGPENEEDPDSGNDGGGPPPLLENGGSPPSPLENEEDGGDPAPLDNENNGTPTLDNENGGLLPLETEDEGPPPLDNEDSGPPPPLDNEDSGPPPPLDIEDSGPPPPLNNQDSGPPPPLENGGGPPLPLDNKDDDDDDAPIPLENEDGFPPPLEDEDGFSPPDLLPESGWSEWPGGTEGRTPKPKPDSWTGWSSRPGWAGWTNEGGDKPEWAGWTDETSTKPPTGSRQDQQPGMIALIIMGVCYLGILAEAAFCRTFQYLGNFLSIQNLQVYMDSVRQRRPAIRFMVECYHYEAKTEQYTVMEQGKRVQKTRTHQVKVVSHRDEHRFRYTRLIDASGDVKGFLSGAVTRLELNWTLGFCDPETEMEYDRQKEEFQNANRERDQHMDYDEKDDFEAFERYISVYDSEAAVQCCMARPYFCLFTMTFMTWIYRCWFSRNSTKKKYTLVKLIGQ